MSGQDRQASFEFAGPYQNSILAGLGLMITEAFHRQRFQTTVVHLVDAVVFVDRLHGQGDEVGLGRQRNRQVHDPADFRRG